MKKDERKQTVKTMRNLPCALSDDEKRDRGRSLADMEHARTQIELEKKSAMTTFKDQLDATDAGINKLVGSIRDGFERRDVDCEWVMLWQSLTKQLVRQDTGEILETAIIEADERQIGLDGVDSN